MGVARNWVEPSVNGRTGWGCWPVLQDTTDDAAPESHWAKDRVISATLGADLPLVVILLVTKSDGDKVSFVVKQGVEGTDSGAALVVALEHDEVLQARKKVFSQVFCTNSAALDNAIMFNHVFTGNRL